MATHSRNHSLHSGRQVGEAEDQAMPNTDCTHVTRASGPAGSHQPPPSATRTTPHAPAQPPDPPATDPTASDARAFLMRAVRWERRLAELRAAHGRARK